MDTKITENTKHIFKEEFADAIKFIIEKKSKKRITEKACEDVARYVLTGFTMAKSCVSDDGKSIIKDNLKSSGVIALLNK